MTLEEYRMKLMNLLAITDDLEEFIRATMQLRREVRQIGFTMEWVGAPFNAYALLPITKKAEEKKDEKPLEPAAK